MESFAALKRRTTDLFNSLPQSLPSKPSNKSQHAYAMNGTWERISVPAVPRSSHSIDVVAGTAYVFGGEGTPRNPADNDMHAVKLPSSGAPADCYSIRAKPERRPAVAAGKPTAATSGSSPDDIPPATGPEANKGKDKEPPNLGDVPGPRVGHATAVIGNRIFLFGGRGEAEEAGPLDERGRVWVFDTKTQLWSYLDPAPAADPIVTSLNEDGTQRATHPAPRSHHAAVATEKPSDFGDGDAHIKPVTRSESWRQWALGDSETVGTPQRPIVGNVAASATDADADGFGTLIIHGGCLAEGRTADTWAFDVRSRVWQELPAAPGGPRSSAALCISKSRLYRFGGFDGSAEQGGRLDVLDLAVNTIDDQHTAGGEVSLAARGGWRSIAQQQQIRTGAEADAASPLAHTAPPPQGAWPCPRGAAALEAITVGGGREYLVLALGERGPAGGGDAGAGEQLDRFLDDVWVFQVPPQGMSAASVHDAVMQAVGRKGGEGTWTRVGMAPYDDEDEDSAVGPGPRGWVASSKMGELEESGIVVWGGMGGGGRRLGDGWILRLG